MYAGQLDSSSKRCGRGTSFYPNTCCTLYFGEWSNDVYEGEGILYYSNGTMHMKGSFVNGLADCEEMNVYDECGRLTFSGKMSQGMMIKGHWWQYTSLSSKFATYQGFSPFVNGVATGRGKFVYTPNSETVHRYEGDIVNFMAHGDGKMNQTSSNGSYEIEYVGKFVNSLFHGSGTLYCNNKKYVGEFVEGLKHGFGVHYSCKSNEKIYEGHYEKNRFHGLGTLFKTPCDYVTGFFQEGFLHNGKIFRNDFMYYEGDLFNFKPFGQGKIIAQQVDCTIEANWNEHTVSSGYSATISIDGSVIYGIVSSYDCKLEKIMFAECVYKRDGKMMFAGKGHFHCRGAKFCQDEGVIYVNEKPRVKSLFEANIPTYISEMYDENGHLQLTCSNDSGYMYGFDGEWPQEIVGPINVLNSDGTLLYEANFNNGITNCLQVSNRIPIKTISRLSEYEDMISFDTIPFDTVCYMLNGRDHVVSKETLLKMRSSHALFKHPYTRAPIIRIERVVAKKI